MKVLVISRSEWSDQNSIGNTLSNIFGGLDVDSIANITFRCGDPQNSICKKYFVLNENIVLNNLKINWLPKIFIKFFIRKKTARLASYNKISSFESSLVKKFRGTQNFLVYLLQDLFWRLPWWKTTGLEEFIEEFKPDIIFFPSFGMPYTHRAARHIAQIASAPLVAFHADDYYFQAPPRNSVTQSIFYKMRATEIKRTIEFASANYAISEKQSELYAGYFDCEFKVLKKGVDVRKYLSTKVDRLIEMNEGRPEVRFLYAGSLEYGRWKSIIFLVEAMQNLRSKGMNFTLDIYSQYHLNDDIHSKLIIEGTSRFLGSISANEVLKKYADVDVVLHVESFDEEDIRLTKHSFSTKIIDCLGSNACAFGFGPPDIASMEYLIENKLGIVCTDKNELERILSGIYAKFELFSKISAASREFVIKNHDLSRIQKELNLDFIKIANEFKGSKNASA